MASSSLPVRKLVLTEGGVLPSLERVLEDLSRRCLSDKPSTLGSSRLLSAVIWLPLSFSPLLPPASRCWSKSADASASEDLR